MATQANLTEANKKLAEQLTTEVWNEKKTGVINDLVAKKCIMHVGGREFRGPKGYREFYDTYVKAFPDLSIQINDIIAEDDFVVTTYTARGQHAGPLMGVDPTGKQVKVRGVNVSRYQNGKLVESNNLFNEMSLLQQVGVLPESILRNIA